MQGRFYAPQWHRFLSPDPARDQHFEETQSWNIYSYVQNLPTMQIDPTGMILEEGERINRGIETIDEPGRVNVQGGYYLALTELSERLMQTNAGAESLGQLLERKGMEAYEKGNTASWIGLGVINAAYQVLTPGGDRLSQVNARAQNGEIAPVKDLAVAGGLALAQVALTAAPGLGQGAKAPVNTVSQWNTNVLPQTGKVLNVATNVPVGQFQSNLVSNGFNIVKQGVSTNGPFSILSNGRTTYSIYTATSTGSTSAQVSNAAGTVLKIRLGWLF